MTRDVHALVRHTEVLPEPPHDVLHDNFHGLCQALPVSGPVGPLVLVLAGYME